MAELNATRGPDTRGLRRLLDPEQQRDWLEGRRVPPDAAERNESLELRFRYLARYEKLLGRSQAPEMLEVLRRYGRDCLPVPRLTERHYWSISCLPSMWPAPTTAWASASGGSRSAPSDSPSSSTG